MKTKKLSFTQEEASLVRRAIYFYENSTLKIIKDFENRMNKEPDLKILLERSKRRYKTLNSIDKKIMKTPVTI